MVALLLTFTAADRFFKRLYGLRTKRADKHCRAYMSFFFKDEYKIVDLKYVFMCKSLVYFIVPPHFRLRPPHFVWSGDRTAGSV